MDEMTWLEETVRDLGGDRVGVADLGAAPGLEAQPRDLLKPYPRAVVYAVRLPGAAVETCLDGPTPEYAHCYRVANEELDRIGFAVARALERRGHRALPLPASQLLDRERLVGHVSYKALARLAGLGWQGKSLLLVTPEFGPRVRLGAVLTDAPLPAGRPVPNRCGSCTACADACPVGAIRGVGTEDHYRSREEAVELSRCAEACFGFAGRPQIEKPICGVCVRACPWGAR